MTDTDTTVSAEGQENLTSLRMAELRTIAAGKGIRGLSAMRKHELIAAIQNAGSGSAPLSDDSRRGDSADQGDQGKGDADKGDSGKGGSDKGDQGKGESGKGGSDKGDQGKGESDRDDSGDQSGNQSGNDDQDDYPSRSQSRRARRDRARQRHREQQNQGGGNQQGQNQNKGDGSQGGNQQGGGNQGQNQNKGDGSQGGNQNQGGNQQGGRNRGGRNQDDQDGGRGGRRNRRNRRDRRGRDNQGGNDEGVREGDVLQPVAGIVDVMDNNSAFVRTSGYLPGSNDVHVSQQIVRKFGLRKGDAITGQVRMPRDGGGGQVTHGSGRNKRKYNPLVQVDTINGQAPDDVRQRPEFGKLTPLYPNQRLRLETEQKILTTRVIDLIMPIGKGQRALVVSPPKAGKTTILQNIANAIATNNPECYMMVVLVDERPEEVTDMQRSVRGEVIASTFDRPPSDHTIVAELAIERAKRLVEQGQDVVVLLDSITRLGRAYNNSSPASGRILSGGVDSNALYPPKRFLGAARNIENGGSLTIIATAMVETGSAGDTVIFEEFKGTGNAELKLDRKISERRVFPAVDVNPSGTRKDDLLLAPDEARVMHKLRRILSALDPQSAIDLLIKQLKKTKNNREFLMQVASSAPMAADVDVDEML